MIPNRFSVQSLTYNEICNISEVEFGMYDTQSMQRINLEIVNYVSPTSRRECTHQSSIPSIGVVENTRDFTSMGVCVGDETTSIVQTTNGLTF
jgi:hypothetical protein